MTQPKVDATTRDAVDWLLRLEAAGEDSSLHQTFDAWLRASPQHAEAWQRVGSLLQLDLPRAEAERLAARADGEPLRAMLPVREED